MEACSDLKLLNFYFMLPQLFSQLPDFRFKFCKSNIAFPIFALVRVHICQWQKTVKKQETCMTVWVSFKRGEQETVQGIKKKSQQSGCLENLKRGDEIFHLSLPHSVSDSKMKVNFVFEHE